MLPACKGRSRKAQKQINSSLSIPGQAKGVYLRLFCEDPRQTKTVGRQIRGARLAPWEAPQEIFEVRHCGLSSNLWASIPTGEAVL